MKKKISKLFGVGIAVILISSLFGFALPVSAAAPLPVINAWDTFDYPLVGSLGGWFWDPAITELGPMDKALNGDIYVYARVPGDANGEHKILRSTDGGRSWADSISPIRYDVVSGIGNQEVVDMVCSSLLEDVIYVTDGDYVYKSSDNAGTWAAVAQPDLENIIEGLCGTACNELAITCLDVGYDAANNPYVFIGVDVTYLTGDVVGTPTGPPDVLYIDELAIGATWISLDLSCYDPASVYTPYAVGVTPDFATAPVKLMAVVTTDDDNDTPYFADGPETHVINSNLGVCGWGEVALLVKDCDPSVATNLFEINHASRIGYPDDYVDGRTLFVGVTAWDGASTNTPGGDVYSVITFPVGVATDLNVAGSVGGCIGLFAGTNICGLDVCGDTADAAVMAGAMDVNITQQPTNVYTSLDGGWTWVTSLKDPTGVDETWVQWVGDDCGASALASTKWCDCAISITCGPDVGLYWNQASLINTCFDCVLWVDHSPGYYDAGVSDTLFMLTGCEDACVRGGDQPCYSVFRYVGDPTLAGTSTPAHPWDRVFSSRLYEAEIDEAGDAIHILGVSPDFLTTEAVFIGNRGFETWRSLDAGCSWFKFAFPCAPRPAASIATVVDKETVVVGGLNALGATTVWKTTRHGTRPFTAAPITAVTANTLPLSFDFDGANFLMGDSASQVFISADGALTWAQVGPPALDVTGFDTSVAFDPGYAVTGDPGENTIYASAGNAIYRCVIDPIFPMSLQAWVPIYSDPGPDANFWGMVTVGDTALYIGDRAASDWPTTVDDGGMVRSLNPTAPAPFVEFERVNFGLAASETLTGLALTSGVNGCPNSNVLWAIDLCWHTPTPGNRVWFFEDTLARPVGLESPANDAKVLGPYGAVIEWEALCGASCYEKEIWYFCPGCDDKSFVAGYPMCDTCPTLVPCVGCSGETCCQVVALPFPGTTYYWRVRVGGMPGVAPCLLACPMLSKWSETRSFTTAMLVPVRCSPICGAEDITLTPNFSWSVVSGATGYDIEVATNEDFDPILASGTASINAWDGIPQLDYDTTYYWRVRAVKDGVVGAWTYCLFSTEEVPPEAPAAVWVCPQCGLTFTSEAALLSHIDEAHAPPSTPAYIWIIIGIGAALVLAVLILIVTTRRAA